MQVGPELPGADPGLGGAEGSEACSLQTLERCKLTSDCGQGSHCLGEEALLGSLLGNEAKKDRKCAGQSKSLPPLSIPESL